MMQNGATVHIRCILDTWIKLTMSNTFISMELEIHGIFAHGSLDHQFFFSSAIIWGINMIIQSGDNMDWLMAP